MITVHLGIARVVPTILQASRWSIRRGDIRDSSSAHGMSGPTATVKQGTKLVVRGTSNSQ